MRHSLLTFSITTTSCLIIIAFCWSMVVRELESNKLVFDVTLGTLSKEERKSGEQGKMRQCMHFGCLQQ